LKAAVEAVASDDIGADATANAITRFEHSGLYPGTLQCPRTR
jgi:hypothetical protein